MSRRLTVGSSPNTVGRMVVEVMRRCVSEQNGLGGFRTVGLDLTAASWEEVMLDRVGSGSMSHLSW